MVRALALALVLLAPKPVEWTFSYRSPVPLKSVAVAGSFNGWSPASDQMKSEDGRNWSLRLSLPPGKHTYKFVLNGSEWIRDPKAKLSEDDGNGNINSVLILSPPEYAKPSKRGDGKVTTSVIGHETTPNSLNYDRGKIHLALTVRPNDVDAVDAIVNGRRYPLARAGADEIAEKWSGYVPWDRKSPLKYRFLIKDGPREIVFGDGPNHNRNFVLDPRTFKPFEVPAWVERTVFYQIFPDRFAKSKDHPGTSPWDTEPRWDTRLGGDIAGILSKAPYLQELGIGAIYFNPMFQSPSIHRYETTDYRRIDPPLGTNEEFARMVRELRSRGIRTVLDLAVNHSAVDFFAFADVLKNGEKSPYRDWYFIHSYPVKVQGNPNYDAWFGFPSMPKLNCRNPEVRQYLLDSVAYWHRLAPIAGWRLDVPNEVDSSFWRAFRPLVKSLNGETWIVGEIWGDGSPWLQGDQFDSVMDYPFRDSVVRFVAEGSIKPSEFAKRLEILQAKYPPQVVRNLMNLLSSHDTPRIATLCHGNQDLIKMAATLLLTWVGAPCIYYGDELGMEGGQDPQNRRGMRWDLAVPGNEILRHYKRLIHLRNVSPALQSGEATFLSRDDAAKFLCYLRQEGDDAAIVAVNRSETPVAKRVLIPERARRIFGKACLNALDGQPVAVAAKTVTVKLGPLQTAVLVPETALYRKTISRF